MFDQMLSSVGAITYKRARKYEFKNTKIKFYKIKKKLYFGFKEEISDIGLVKIADKEKAILDILYFFSDLLRLVKNKNSYGKMAFDAKKFDAKWRLYYDDRVIQ
ncbi:hypothetical protein HZA55_10695 [Candidatus Poribacteria bacterium]|nr:hypothetical protein [Candidatus Poribacteria bacterium]